MTLGEAVQTLFKAGLFAQHTPEKTFCDIMVFGAPETAINKIEHFQWVCWIDSQDLSWRVCLPPHPTPGPGPEFITSTLKEAVSLIIFVFARRLLFEGISTKQEFEYTHRIYNEWLQIHNKQ